MLREELFHPATVHFPIAFLGVVGFAAAFWLVTRRGSATLLFLLTFGVAGGWIGILTGGWAEDVVNRVICDPTVTHDHEMWAEWSVWVASAVWPLLAVAHFRRSSSNSYFRKPIVRSIVASALLFVSGSVLWAGHLGASLVYQQGAAVYKPGPQCTEFE